MNFFQPSKTKIDYDDKIGQLLTERNGLGTAVFLDHLHKRIETLSDVVTLSSYCGM